jgi:EAL domain-containing protein (putative c-di-GMP-specific phosphodiesterase class I)
MSQLLDELMRSNTKGISSGDEGKPELSMSELLAGMVNREFFFHHQPIIDLASGMQIGSEMLMRWIRRGEVLAPMWFMPMIERHALTTELDHYVVDRFSEIPWEQTVRPNFLYRVFMNISAQSFIDPNFLNNITEAAKLMEKNGILPVLELSERTSCEIDYVKKQMFQLHDQGIEIALDDFGIGYSSMSRLIDLPVDILKIDRSIICLIGKSARAETITRSIFDLSRSLNIKIVAEGVETEVQANWLAQSGPCWVQGFYYARPTLVGFVQSSNSSLVLADQRVPQEK